MAEEGLERAVAALERALSRARVRHMLIGGVAVIAHGVRRLTDDVDAALWAHGVDVESILVVLKRESILPRIKDAAAFARRTQVLLLRHEPSGIDVDLSLASLPFEDVALDRARAVRIKRVTIPVALPADLIVYKALAGRERDLSDVERLLEIHRKTIDLTDVKRTVRQLSNALERPELFDDLERIIGKVTGKSRSSARSVARRPRRKT